MSKVKKAPALTGVRNVKASKRGARPSAGSGAAVLKKAGKTAGKAAPRKSSRAAGKPLAKGTGAKARSTSSTPAKSARPDAAERVVRGKRIAGKTAKKRLPAKVAKQRPLGLVKGSKGRPVRPEPVARYAIKELDPLRKCGASTSVQFLYRVDETVEGRTTAHLVFFDHHGWYCEHGRTCPAVAPARKHNGHIARVS